MTTTKTGRNAESTVANYLHSLGYSIRDQNWRTRWCEIDVVATKNNVVYFVEVKYRRSNAQGDGLDYITPKKLQQMTFAAELWVTANVWNDSYELAAAAVTGEDFVVTDFIVL